VASKPSSTHHATGVVLGQLAVAAKSNEIPAVTDLLAGFAAEDLRGCVVTVEALHTQTATATAIIGAGADYVFTVKANQPGLLARLKSTALARHPDPHPDRHQPGPPDHPHPQSRPGPRVDRVCWGGPGRSAPPHSHDQRHQNRGGGLPDHFGHRHCCLTGGLGRLGAKSLGNRNRIHWVRDVTFDEDRSQVRTGNAPQVMATVRNTAISLLRLTGWTNIAQALRHHARHPDQTISHLLNR
jgi:predicted transposase YbfD/YdcC